MCFLTSTPPPFLRFRPVSLSPYLTPQRLVTTVPCNPKGLETHEKINVSGLIQTTWGPDTGGAALSDRDLAKQAKSRAKQERAQVAAFKAHQEAMESVKAERPRIVRNAGTLGARDIHLNAFSVSNGGQELLEDADLILAHGRRYGLIGRNGTGRFISPPLLQSICPPSAPYPPY